VHNPAIVNVNNTRKYGQYETARAGRRQAMVQGPIPYGVVEKVFHDQGQMTVSVDEVMDNHYLRVVHPATTCAAVRNRERTVSSAAKDREAS
jgi:hypothetical protein